MKKSIMGNSRAAGGKGFYIALILSVAAVGTVAYFTISRLTDSLKAASESGTDQNIEWSLPEGTEDVNKDKTDVPKTDPSGNSDQAAPSGDSSKEASQPEEDTFLSSKKEDKGSSESVSAGTGYIMPLDGEMINGFSAGELVKSKTLGEWRTHDGIDIKADEGSPVKSVGDGVVTDIRDDRQWGVVVEIEYPDFTAVYAGISSEVLVSKDSKVSLGDVIGYVANSSVIESAEDSHLHFAAKVNGQWVDPLSLLNQ